jgi:hypothetical protein
VQHMFTPSGIRVSTLVYRARVYTLDLGSGVFP